MKLPSKPSQNNPLLKILRLFSTEYDDLALDQLHTVAELLAQSGIVCDEYYEVFKCLAVLEEMNLLALEEITDLKTGYTSYKVKRIYET